MTYLICQDIVWPPLSAIARLTYAIHDPTGHRKGESSCFHLPLNSLSFLRYSSLLFFLLFHLFNQGSKSEFWSMFHERWLAQLVSREGGCGLEWNDKQWEEIYGQKLACLWLQSTTANILHFHRGGTMTWQLYRGCSYIAFHCDVFG